MNRSIELHDTEITGATTVDCQVVMLLRAYVHESVGKPGVDPGSCWVQAAVLLLAGATCQGELPDATIEILDGTLSVNGQVMVNEIPIPFDESGDICLSTTLLNGKQLTITALGALLTMIGEAVFVENFES